MLRRLILLFGFIGFLQGQGIYMNDSFYSVSLGQTRSMDIYLPAGYDPTDSTRRYPVIYFLHGRSGDSYALSSLGGVMNLIRNHSIEPWLLVMPDGMLRAPLLDRDDDGCYYTNSELTGMFEDYIVYDLVAYIDSAYRTIPDSSRRIVMGHSMGGYGALKLGLKHPDVFGGLAAHSAPEAIFMSRWDIPTLRYDLLSEYSGSGELDPDAGAVTNRMFRYAAYFSPNLDRPPYFVDLLFDTTGSINDSVWARWQLHSGDYLASRLDPDNAPAIFIDCGLYDGNIYLNSVLASYLRYLGIPHEFQSYEGGHTDKRTQRWPVAAAFLDSVLHRGLPRSRQASVSSVYAAPGADSLGIITAINNPRGHTINAAAVLKPWNEAAIDTIPLFDDGSHDDGYGADGIWGSAQWQVPAEEAFYSVDIQIVDADSGLTHTCYDATHFATVGPLVFADDSLVTPPRVLNPTYHPNTYIALNNLGSLTSAPGVKATLSALDTCVVDIRKDKVSFSDIPAGELVFSEDYFQIDFNPACDVATDVRFAISISSMGYEFWSDTFAIAITQLGVTDRVDELPTAFVLHQNYPNPFNPASMIEYHLPWVSEVSLIVYDILGREVARLVDGAMEPGHHSVLWEARDQKGREVPSGIYIAKLMTPEYSESIKMVLLR